MSTAARGSDRYLHAVAVAVADGSVADDHYFELQERGDDQGREPFLCLILLVSRAHSREQSHLIARRAS